MDTYDKQTVKSMVDKAIVADRDIDNGDNDGYAFNFAFIASIYVIDQLAVDDAMSARHTLATLMGRINNHRIRYISTIFYLYAATRWGGTVVSIAWDTSENKFTVQSFGLGMLSSLQERYIRVGNAATLNSHKNLDSFIFFILKCLGGICDYVPEAQRSAYIGAFTKNKFEKFCKALLVGDTDVILPIPSADGSSVEKRRIRTPNAPNSNSVLYKVLNCLVPTTEIARETAETVTSDDTTPAAEITAPGSSSFKTEIAEAPTSTKENNVTWWVIAIIIAASILVSGFGFFMSFTSYIAFSAINIVAPFIAALGLTAAIALPVGIAIKEHYNRSCCNELVERFRNHPKSEEPLLDGNDKDASR